MTAPHDLDRQLDAFLLTGPTELPDPSFDAVRDSIEHTRQRAVLGLWRVPEIMNKYVPIALGAAALVAAVAIGVQLLRPPNSGPGGAVGGTVSFQLDGGPATTKVDVVADGASVTGTAVTTLVTGTHTVTVECAARDGDTWAFGGTVEQTTVPGEAADQWSAVVVRDGAPQRIGIWFSDPKAAGTDCDGWLAGIDLADIGAENFNPVESGELAPPAAVGS